jgi:glycerophosphoryl diester phosphodiesterase
MGAGILECDVAFKDKELVCRHAQCDLHTTTNILAVPELAANCTQPFTPADLANKKAASAKCCTSDLTLAEFKRLKGKMDASDKERHDGRGLYGGHGELAHRPLRRIRRHIGEPQGKHPAVQGTGRKVHRS